MIKLSLMQPALKVISIREFSRDLTSEDMHIIVVTCGCNYYILVYMSYS